MPPPLAIRTLFLVSLPYRHAYQLGCRIQPSQGPYQLKHRKIVLSGQNSTCFAIPATKQKPLLVSTPSILLAREDHEIHNPDFIDAPAKPGSGALNWGNFSHPPPLLRDNRQFQRHFCLSQHRKHYQYLLDRAQRYCRNISQCQGQPHNKDAKCHQWQGKRSGLDGDNFLSLRR